MMFLRKLKLMRECFPQSWLRKLPLLFFPSDTFMKDGALAGICTTFRSKIILLCVSKRFRGQGIGGLLINRSRGTHTYTYAINEGALELWQKNGFRLVRTEDSVFGKRHILVREQSGKKR